MVKAKTKQPNTIFNNEINNLKKIFQNSTKDELFPNGKKKRDSSSSPISSGKPNPFLKSGNKEADNLDSKFNANFNKSSPEKIEVLEQPAADLFGAGIKIA